MYKKNEYVLNNSNATPIEFTYSVVCQSLDVIYSEYIFFLRSIGA